MRRPDIYQFWLQRTRRSVPGLRSSSGFERILSDLAVQPYGMMDNVVAAAVDEHQAHGPHPTTTLSDIRGSDPPFPRFMSSSKIRRLGLQLESHAVAPSVPRILV